jgi:hypothetical protein
MEVHHHPDLHHKRKNFKEYFLEFLMIFIAVTLGFFAENIREHYTERNNAKEYLESYRDELLQQQVMYNHYKKVYQNKIVVCDTIKAIFYNREENKKIDELERLLVPGITHISTPFNTSSYDQMVSSGALRYINNIALRDSMGVYKSSIETLKDYNKYIEQSISNDIIEIAKLEDFSDVVSTDTAVSYDLSQHIPNMKPFRKLSDDERASLLFFYETFIVQAQSNLRRIRLLYASNLNLKKMINKELDK